VILVLILYGGYEPTSIEQVGLVELNLVRKKRQVANLCLLRNILSFFVFIVTVIIIYHYRNVSCFQWQVGLQVGQKGFHNLFIHNFSLSVLHNYKRTVPWGRFTAQDFPKSTKIFLP